MDTGLDSSKTAFKKVARILSEFLGNKIAGTVTNSYDDKIMKTKPVEQTIIPPENKRRNIKRIKKSIPKMELCKISNLLVNSSVSKWIEVNDLSSAQYSVNKNIRFNTSLSTSDLSYYSDAYIVVKEIADLLAAAANEIDKAEKNVAFKNNAPFRS